MNCCLESAGTDAGRCPQEEGRVRGCRWTVQDAAVDGACLWLPANRTAPQRSRGRIQDNPEGMDLGEVLSPDAGQCWPCLSCTLCKVSSCHGIRGCSQGQDGRPPPPPQLRGTSTQNQSSTGPGTLDCGANPPHWEAEGPWTPSQQRSSAPSGAKNGAQVMGRGRMGQRWPPLQIKAMPTRCQCHQTLPSRGVQITPAGVSPLSDIPGNLLLPSEGTRFSFIMK